MENHSRVKDGIDNSMSTSKNKKPTSTIMEGVQHNIESMVDVK